MRRELGLVPGEHEHGIGGRGVGAFRLDRKVRALPDEGDLLAWPDLEFHVE
jgi:hypothetical protein